MYTLSMVVFLKLGECGNGSLIPILLGSLPLAHNAQHSLVIRSRDNDGARKCFYCK